MTCGGPPEIILGSAALRVMIFLSHLLNSIVLLKGVLILSLASSNGSLRIVERSFSFSIPVRWSSSPLVLVISISVVSANEGALNEYMVRARRPIRTIVNTLKFTLGLRIP